MNQIDGVTIRKFEFTDIPAKIEWINDPSNNQYLHYDLPLEYGKTVTWFQQNKNRTDRFDAVIEFNGLPVGLIGLLSIDRRSRKAEYYVSMGNTLYKGRGIAYKASKILLEYAFFILGLEKVYLYTETENVVAQKLFNKIGFHIEGILKSDLISRGNFVDRFVYGYTKGDYFRDAYVTPIHQIDEFNNNTIYMKRDDMIPYSFGGNKVRKATLFFEEIDKHECDCVITYGSSHSNHCRIVSNMAAAKKMPCYIIAPEEVSDQTFNSRFMELFGAKITVVPVNKVHDTIEDQLTELRCAGKKPYFIPGGGHGNIGTQAYVNCYEEIQHYEEIEHIHFDYIFLASGTGTTQAGLVCGQLMCGDDREIIGISIARKNPRGREVVLDSIREYLAGRDVKIAEEEIQKKTIFVDDYTGSGYAKDNAEIVAVIKQVLKAYGIPLDSTYTGKAFYGMNSYIQAKGISGKNILFLHTGGTPLFFDDLRRF